MNDCDYWLCIKCIVLSEPECILLKKNDSSYGLSMDMSNVQGKYQASNGNASKITRVVDASIKNSFSGFENAVKTLYVKIKEAVKDSFC